MCEKWINCLAFVPLGVSVWVCVWIDDCGWSIHGKQKAHVSRENTHSHTRTHKHPQQSIQWLNVMWWFYAFVRNVFVWYGIPSHTNINVLLFNVVCAMYVHTLIFSIMIFMEIAHFFSHLSLKNWWASFIASGETLNVCMSCLLFNKVKSKILR